MLGEVERAAQSAAQRERARLVVRQYRGHRGPFEIVRSERFAVPPGLLSPVYLCAPVRLPTPVDEIRALRVATLSRRNV